LDNSAHYLNKVNKYDSRTTEYYTSQLNLLDLQFSTHARYNCTYRTWYLFQLKHSIYIQLIIEYKKNIYI